MIDKKITSSFLHKYYENEALEENRKEKMYESDKYNSYWQNIRLDEIIKIFKKINVDNFLEVGCAEGIYLKEFKKFHKHSEIFGLDIASNYLKKVRINDNDKDILLFQGDANNLPFRTCSFDAVLCSETLEHVIDPKKSLYELYRVSRKYLIISVPGHTPFFFLGRYIGIIKKDNILDQFSSPGKGHINDLDTKLLKYYLCEIDGKFSVVKQETYCYFPPELIKKCRIPLILIRFMNGIINIVPFLNSFGLVHILVIEKNKCDME